MKIFLDDIREAPAGWRRVYRPDEAIALLAQGGVTVLSLDHDLGDYRDSKRRSGDCILW